jgi:outer membrane protein OmpA-like peptidoglycan-associated protein
MNNKLSRSILITALCCCVWACTPPPVINPAAPDTHETEVPVVTPQTSAVTDAIDALASQGVDVQRTGDTYKIIIPAALIFQGRHAQLSDQADAVLPAVVALIRAQPKETVAVSAYSNPVESTEVDTALTQRQANAIQEYLWRHEVAVRLIYANGYGSKNPVNFDSAHEALNDRIEIVFKALNSEPHVNLINY